MAKCNQCSSEFKSLGNHWARGSCDYPTLNEEQYQIATGLLMGDGSIHKGSKYPFLQSGMITKPYLEYVDSKFDNLSTGVSKSSRMTSAGNEVFNWNTRCLPQLEEFEDWYKDGKSWPKDLELTPTVLKHLYVCDGNFDNSGSAKRIRISMSNERQCKEKVESLFSEIGFEICRWSESERPKLGGVRCSAIFSKEETENMFEYMGSSLPGFEYKWPNGGD